MATMHTLKANLLLAAAYALLGMAGMALAIAPGYATAIFPAAGVALASILVKGNRLLPGVWLGSMLLNLWIGLTHGGVDLRAAGVAFFIGGGAMVQAAAGAWLIRRRTGQGWQQLDHDSHILWFLLLGGPVASLISATTGSLALFEAGLLPPTGFSFNWWNWWIGDTIGALLFAPLTLMMLNTDQPLWRTRLRRVALPTLTAGAGLVVIFIYVSSNENRLLESRIQAEGRNISEALRTQISNNEEVIHGLGRTIGILPAMGLAEFQRLAIPIFQKHPQLQALSWNPLVQSAQRKSFEDSLAKEYGKPGLHISERGRDGTLHPAGDREFYVSVQYIAPLSDNRRAVGYDIASDPVRREALERATASQDSAATARVNLIQLEDTATDSGILVLAPVFSTGAPPDAKPRGFAVGVMRIDRIAQMILQAHGAGGLQFSLDDITRADSPQHLYGTSITGANPGWSDNIAFGGRVWRLQVTPDATYLASHRSLLAWSVLAAGLALASLLQAMLLGMTGRESMTERTVEEKTAELIAKEARLRESEELWRFALEGAGDGVWDVDVPSGKSHYSPRWKAMLGYGEEEVGSSFEDWLGLIHPEDLPQVMGAVNAYSAGQIPLYACEYRLRCRDGSYKWILARGMAVSRSADGKPLRMVGTHSDMTLRHEAEDAMRQAQAMAEQNARTRSEFLANMSHEIRTPMNGIIGLTQLALNQQISPEVRDYLQKISASSQSLLGILNDILDFSKLEAGRMTIEQNRFDLDTLLDNLRNLFEGRAQAKHLDFRIVIDDDVPLELVGDSMRMQQVLINLLGNAIKFTTAGHVTLQVKSRPAAAGKTRLHFSVEDSGIGMSDVDMARLFQPFSQADSSITRRFGGTGLGLAISHNLAELMGGHIDVTSQAGQGSTFSFELTLTVAEQNQARARKRRPVQDAGTLTDRMHRLAAGLHGAHILLVEDNAINQQVVKEFLTLSGMRVSIANNGQEALQLLAVNQFDAVLMDAHMPVMDGFEATRQIRADQSLSALPVIALTAGVTQEDRERCAASGMSDFVPKPVSPEDLITALAKWVPPRDTGKRAAGDTADDAPLLLLVKDDPAALQEVATMLRHRYHVKLATSGQVALEIASRSPHPDLIVLDSELPEPNAYELCRALKAADATRNIPVILMLAGGIIGSPVMAEKMGVAALIEAGASPDEILQTLQRVVQKD